MTEVTKNSRLFDLQPHVTRCCLLCVFKLFPPIGIQHTQSPCPYVILLIATKALQSQASRQTYRHASQVQDTRHIRGILMHVASGLFSWGRLLAFSRRQFAPTINHGPTSVRFTHYFYLSFPSKHSGWRMPPAERSALCIYRLYASLKTPWIV